MKLQFDSTLEYQKEAIEAITGLFEGMGNTDQEIELAETQAPVFSELVVANLLTLPQSQILTNLQNIQTTNNIPKSISLKSEIDTYSFTNFSVEMETGTGKTYVYLKTIFELNKLYGLKKFIIVVPSVAIREGVTSSIRLMKDHFKKLYDNTAFDSFVYSSKDLSRVRQFAINNQIQIMVINIQAFQKDAGQNVEYTSLSTDEKKKLNIIHQEQDKMSGKRPIEYIQATNPIVIIDEPQSVDNTDKSQNAIKNLNPLFALRYSATHKNPYNLVYQLDPVKAYDMKIVKQIEVVDASGGQDFNQNLVRLDAVGYWPASSKSPQAKITIYEDTPNGTREKQIKVKNGIDLSQQSSRKEYEDYVVSGISADAGNEYVEFQNGQTIELNQAADGNGDERMKSQIKQTIEQHLAKEKAFRGKGVKVLSLFFIDHVKSYRFYDDLGNRQKGKLAIWFEEIYHELAQSSRYKDIVKHDAISVHDGYFSTDKKKGKIVEELDTTGSTSKDDDTYELIMKDKERLLDENEPLRFIFSHSALREGWDNPNVFQICTLREMGTDRERRQTIGRGLRLPVNQQGERIFDTQINRLTVIANESFENFAKGLQSDFELAIDPSGKFKFGRVPKLAFTTVLNPEKTSYLTQEESNQIWQHLREQELINQEGDFTQNFKPNEPNFSLNLAVDLSPIESDILARLDKFVPREFVKNSKDREKISYNKRVELNEDFQVLWQKISQKTRYSVEFDTQELIQKAIEKIKDIPKIEPVQIEITKRQLKILESGVSGAIEDFRTSFKIQNTQPLPDIIAYLQRETELTRQTLVEILTKTERIPEFKLNPQVFMMELAKAINKAMSELVVDGIKYEAMEGQKYEMKLFENQEMEEYVNRLYQTSSNDNRTPYDFIAFDSEIENQTAQRLDNDERVKFFCKLPRWFKISTPVGEYNPDWALVVENEEKLYLVRETKSTLERDKRRLSENQKVDCGKAHFRALGVDFKDVDKLLNVLS
ncbi:MAG: DEAD/DEAH box helicase family protein [bacterium]